MKNKIVKLIKDTIEICDEIIYSIKEDKVDINKVMDFIILLSKLSKNAYELNHDEIIIEELNEKLNCLLEALEEKDMELFSDNLEYELKPLIEYWMEVI